MRPGDTQVIASDHTGHRDPVGERAVIALKKKSALYAGSGRDLVLLIHYRVTNFEEADLPDILHAVEAVDVDFREVWAVSDWWMRGGLTHRIWVPPDAH